MIIQSLIKRKQGTNVLLGTIKYEFRPNTAGDHVAEVSNKEHIETLLAIEHGFKEYKAGGKKTETPAAPAAETPVAPAAETPAAPAAETPAAPAADEKAALLAEAKALGINANSNWGVGGLKKAIAKVKGN